MKTTSPSSFALALLLSSLLAIPADVYAVPQATGQRAGEVSRVIPAAQIARGPKTITASPKSVVDWADLVNTQVNGRARVSLDDGSVLNVGSESSMKVEKHDAGAQQTQLELTYGKLRSQAQKIAKPDGKFEVHTPAGVAGVVGTDFYVGYDNGTMTVIAFEGVVRVCNLAGVCVLVKAGQTSSVRNDNNSNSVPTPPAQATLDVLTDAVVATNVGSVGPGALKGLETAGHHPGLAMAIGLGIAAAVPIAVIPALTRKSSVPTPQAIPPPPSTGCNPTNQQGC